jgi:thymidylate synthase (FAD)
MILIKPSFKIESELNGLKILNALEKYGRTCYKSEGKITKGSSKAFIKMIVERGHETILEHEKATVRFICDRGVTHEIVRHRLASYSQESTRYCNYKGGVTFIIPSWLTCAGGEYTKKVSIDDPRITDNEGGSAVCWFNSMLDAETDYKELLDNGWTPQQARSVLPNSLKTEIVMTANLREWRWFFLKRASKYAHPQMQELAYPLLKEFQELVPIIFDGINDDEK